MVWPCSLPIPDRGLRRCCILHLFVDYRLMALVWAPFSARGTCMVLRMLHNGGGNLIFSKHEVLFAAALGNQLRRPVLGEAIFTRFIFSSWKGRAFQL